MANSEKRIIDLTVAELQELIEHTVILCMEERNISGTQEDEYVNGIRGLASILKCGTSRAQAIHSSGILDSSTIRIGRRVMFDKRKTLQIVANNNKKFNRVLKGV